MIIWILNSESGIKLLYKSFLRTDADEDIVSGFLSAFYHFSMVEFHEELESIEMGGLRWIYILEPEFNLLFVAADTKNIKTEMLMGKLNVIRKAFIKEYEEILTKRKKSWEGDLNVFTPFLKVIEDYNTQWHEMESVAHVADYFDILGIFQQLLIMFHNILENRMYSKSKIEIIDLIEKRYKAVGNKKKFKDQEELKNISFSKDSWFNIIDINLIKCDKELVLDYLEIILKEIINAFKKVKGDNLCYKYFNEEGIYAYIYNNMKLLKDLKLDLFFLESFLLL
ncbi:MAG: hypothetical protein EU531_04050 [Promethearchaeota archaeon]|nr:MAG: hypothetical protein EU531_04050 [Candidatus Lokiarchaeota archaeon]